MFFRRVSLVSVPFRYWHDSERMTAPLPAAVRFSVHSPARLFAPVPVSAPVFRSPFRQNTNGLPPPARKG